MDWLVIAGIIIGIILFFKVISKLVKLAIGLLIIAAIFYFFTSMDLAMLAIEQLPLSRALV